MENELPKGWVNVPFIEILDVQGGTQPPKSNFLYNYSEGYIRLLQIRDFGQKPMPTFIPYKSKLKTCNKDDILIARYGASLGRIVTGMEGAYNVALAKVIIPEEVHKKYFYYLLKSEIFQRPILANTRSAQDGFNKDDLERINIPIPPVEEQQRIVAKLDSILARINNCKTRLDKIPTLLKNFRQSVLAAAVSGELTKEWREENDDYSVEELIKIVNVRRHEEYEKLLAEAVKNKATKPRKPSNLTVTTVEKEELPVPSEWRQITIESAASTRHYSLSSGPFGSALGTKDYHASGVPVIRGQNIQNGTFSDANFVFVSSEKAKELRRSSVAAGDLVVVAVGSSGQVALIPEQYSGAVMSQNCNKISFDEELVLAKYALLVLQNSITISQLKDKTTDTARPFLSLTNLKTVTIPLPFIEEQKEIVRKVEELFHFADSIEARYQKAKAWFDKIPQAILSKAFKGQLVPQHQTDEPASVLLERIKKEKQLTIKLKTKTTSKTRTLYEENGRVSMVAEE